MNSNNSLKLECPAQEPCEFNNWMNLLSGQVVSYKRGDVIAKASTPISHALYLEEGVVKTIKENQNGRNNILEINNPGSFMGLMCLLSGSENTYTCIALTNTKVRFIRKDELENLLKYNPHMYEEIIRHILKRAQKNINRLITINNKQLPGRVADVILYFHELYNGAYQFEFPLSREELAQFCGTTKESFIRTLTEFKNDKILFIDGKKITINSMEIIQTLSRLG
jgi:CRP-like cAMP-binding protein